MELRFVKYQTVAQEWLRLLNSVSDDDQYPSLSLLRAESSFNVV